MIMLGLVYNIFSLPTASSHDKLLDIRNYSAYPLFLVLQLKTLFLGVVLWVISASILGYTFYNDYQKGDIPKRHVGTVLSHNSIFFEFNSCDVSSNYVDTLNSISSLLLINKKLNVKIKGYTDSVGTKDYNKELSRKRAQNVAKYFKNLGIAKERIKLEYYGENSLLASNDTDRGRYLNRRVDIKVFERRE